MKRMLKPAPERERFGYTSLYHTAAARGWSLSFDAGRECYKCVDLKTGNIGFGRDTRAAYAALRSFIEQLKEERLWLLKALG